MTDSPKNIRIKYDLAKTDRPRERMQTGGVEILTDAELLAILLGSGSAKKNAIELAQEILAKLGGFSGIHKSDLSQLQEFNGIGLAKAATIKAAVEVGARLAKETPDEKFYIRAPEDISRLLGHELMGKTQEELWVVRVNARNMVLDKERLYIGSQDSSTARVSEIFKNAVRSGAYGLVLVHNHPSGDAQESPEDVNLTQAVVDAGQLLDIKVIDHIIIGWNELTSIRRNHPGIWA